MFQRNVYEWSWLNLASKHVNPLAMFFSWTSPGWFDQPSRFVQLLIVCTCNGYVCTWRFFLRDFTLDHELQYCFALFRKGYVSKKCLWRVMFQRNVYEWSWFNLASKHVSPRAMFISWTSPGWFDQPMFVSWTSPCSFLGPAQKNVLQ